MELFDRELYFTKGDHGEHYCREEQSCPECEGAEEEYYLRGCEEKAA